MVNTATNKVTKRGLAVLRQTLLDWPRALAVSDDGSEIAVVSRGIYITNAAATKTVAGTLLAGVADRAVFNGRGSLVLSQGGQRVIWLDRRPDSRSSAGKGPHALAITKEIDVPNVVAVSRVTARGQLVILDQRGKLRFVDETSSKSIGQVSAHGRVTDSKATSVTVSSGGEWAAVGFAPIDYSQSDQARGFVDILDLRMGDLPAIAERPLATTTPAHLSAVASASSAGLPSQIQVVLRLLRMMLEHRFRYDIGITDVQALTAGEYDIYLERG